MRRAVLLNHLPAAGNSTIAQDIAVAMNIPVLALDATKEALFRKLGIGDRLYNRRKGQASYVGTWATLGAFPSGCTVSLDACSGFQRMELLCQHLAQAGVSRGFRVWCHAPSDTIPQRYLAWCGERHEGHLGQEYVPEFRVLPERAQPFSLQPVIDVDTDHPVDVSPRVHAIRKALIVPGGNGSNRALLSANRTCSNVLVEGTGLT